jgi:ABC-type bacteriocin/lantibiotic exporter with double-glycine peptidase domain
VKGFLFALLTQCVVSGEELRFEYIDKQGLDTSCGIAVTASLLNIYWNIPVKEEDLYAAMVFDTAQADDPTYSISFHTMSAYLQKHGIVSRAYKMDWNALRDSLNKNFAPIVVHYAEPVPHFALLLYMDDERAYVADPAKGMGVVNRSLFEKNYSGNALLTASRSARKRTEAIDRCIAVETARQKRLNALASRRIVRGF